MSKMATAETGERRARRQFTTEFKTGAVRLVLDEGKKISEVARDLDLTESALRGWVERPAHIRYRGLGLDGAMIERVARGFHARVVQHECDHLDGRLYPSRMDDLTRLIFESELRHFQLAG